MAETKKTTAKKTSTKKTETLTAKDVQAQVKALELRVEALENHKKAFDVSDIELDGMEEKVKAWLSDNTLVKLAGVVVVAIILFNFIF